MRVGFTCSAFDLLHSGHITMLRECKGQCDYLVVGLQVDPSRDREEKNRPIQSVSERMIQLQGCKYVDEIICYETEHELLNLISLLNIDVRFLGEEYRGKAFTGHSVCKERCIEIVYNKRQHNFSTSELRKRIRDD